jgi:hypothetical protein
VGGDMDKDIVGKAGLEMEGGKMGGKEWGLISKVQPYLVCLLARRVIYGKLAAKENVSKEKKKNRYEKTDQKPSIPILRVEVFTRLRDYPNPYLSQVYLVSGWVTCTSANPYSLHRTRGKHIDYYYLYDPFSNNKDEDKIVNITTVVNNKTFSVTMNDRELTLKEVRQLDEWLEWKKAIKAELAQLKQIGTVRGGHMLDSKIAQMPCQYHQEN